jgi:polyhydroxyalkanoate synthesis regulator phasin
MYQHGYDDQALDMLIDTMISEGIITQDEANKFLAQYADQATSP